MTTERIKEIQKTTGYPDSVSIQQALLQVWNEVAQESRPLEKLVIPKTADVGITVRPERPEDMPKTITVITEDFIRLITIAGSLCHPKAPSIYKQRMDGELRKIAVRHHINYVGEIKE